MSFSSLINYYFYSEDFWNKYELIDVLNLSRRHKEEIEISKREMCSHLQCLMDQRAVLLSDLAYYCDGIDISLLDQVRSIIQVHSAFLIDLFYFLARIFAYN